MTTDNLIAEIEDELLPKLDTQPGYFSDRLMACRTEADADLIDDLRTDRRKGAEAIRLLLSDRKALIAERDAADIAIGEHESVALELRGKIEVAEALNKSLTERAERADKDAAALAERWQTDRTLVEQLSEAAIRRTAELEAAIERAEKAEAAVAVRSFAAGPQSAGTGPAWHLRWIAARLQYIHGENPNYDYMLRLREIADEIERASARIKELEADNG